MAHKKTGTPRKKVVAKKRHPKPALRMEREAPSPSPILDRRAAEKSLFDLGKLMDKQNFTSIEEVNAFLQQFMNVSDITVPSEELTPVEQAQEKMYEAWNAKGQRRVALAHEALEISADCADAYVLLAEETARTPAAALKLYEQGMQAGERALGEEFLHQNAGHFWGLMETRPYMRARAGVAECLLVLGEVESAIQHYQEMLRLNPSDNQGHRYRLTHLLLKEGRDEELAALLKQYDDEWTAEWLYTRALASYRQQGAEPEASRWLKQAFEANRYVPALLLGFEKMPRRPPDYIGVGDKNEAVQYIAYHQKAWMDTPGALQWFVSVFKEVLMEYEKSNSEP
ncbi:MAG: hypothetical protein HY231_13220 [Acidobacteria bacterium]|nr:hypothetical protein [Acidobacteriota bacterium]